MDGIEKFYDMAGTKFVPSIVLNRAKYISGTTRTTGVSKQHIFTSTHPISFKQSNTNDYSQAQVADVFLENKSLHGHPFSNAT